MTTVLAFKDLIDKPEFRPLSIAPTTSTAGKCLAFDLRNTGNKEPNLWHLTALTAFEKYLKAADDWITTAAFTAVGGAIGAGSGVMFVPSHGPAGTVGASPANTGITLAALPNASSVGINQLANAGDGSGYRIRIIGKTSGKIEERTIVANTAGTTPVVTFDTPLSFVPTITDTYEVLSGRIYILGSGTTAAGYFKAFDIATQSISGNLSVTNLAATIGTDFSAVALDEQYVPNTSNPGEGMILGGATYNGGLLKCIVATAAAAGSITGSGMPAGLLANEFSNYQVRIVEDTTNPTAVGQRRKITSHTGGATAVFTVAAWAVTPSATAKFVVENNNDLLLWTNAAAVTYSYLAGGFAADAAWSTAAIAGGAMVQYANPPAAMGAGCMAESCFPITPDAAKNARNSHIMWFRGAATTTLYYLDIAAGSNGTWSAAVTYGNNQSITFTTGCSSAQDAATNGGKYMYINMGSQRIYRFDMLNRVLEPWCYIRYAQSTAVAGGKLATGTFIDGSTKLGFLYLIRQTGQEFFDCILQR